MNLYYPKKFCKSSVYKANKKLNTLFVIISRNQKEKKPINSLHKIKKLTPKLINETESAASKKSVDFLRN